MERFWRSRIVDTVDVYVRCRRPRGRVTGLLPFWALVAIKITLALACSASSFFCKSQSHFRKPFGNVASIPFFKLNVVYLFYVINIVIYFVRTYGKMSTKGGHFGNNASILACKGEDVVHTLRYEDRGSQMG